MAGTDKKQIILYIIALVVLFIIPIYLISSNSDALKGGIEYKFKVKAYDPYDMLRGNYINIRFLESEVKGYYTSELNSYEESDYYVSISKNSEGFAYFKTASKVKPSASNYYKTKGRYFQAYNSGDFENIEESKLNITTPTRYYMNEKKAMNAGNLYRENIDNVYVKVRVKDGKMVIVGVYVNDKLIDSIDGGIN